MIENQKLSLSVDNEGYVSSLKIKQDPYEMNWVIDKDYLESAGYQDSDKLFGCFDITADGEHMNHHTVQPAVTKQAECVDVCYDLPRIQLRMVYDLKQQKDGLQWTIALKNKTNQMIHVSDLGIWISFAYVMFRDKNVAKNTHCSAAVFPSISKNYTKLRMVRRDGEGESLGMYQAEGETASIGTYCDYVNLFFENVSPSLDGMLFHKLYLAGGYPEGFQNADWIYEKNGFTLQTHENKQWVYNIRSFRTEDEFHAQALKCNHPKINYPPLNIIGGQVSGTIVLPDKLALQSAAAWYLAHGEKKQLPVLMQQGKDKSQYRFSFQPQAMGEHKVVFTFADGTEDHVVLNVMDRLNKVIEERVAYICDQLYTGADGKPAYAFQPISNQGESLGKANLVLKKNLLGSLDVSQVRKVECSAVNYVREKWFIDGDFKRPRKLYGDFYRCMDFEYIGHLFYLLSEFPDDVLALNPSDTYLKWAADVFDLRVNPDLHEEERGKEEAQMLGVYFLYFNGLLKKLQEKGLTAEYQRIHALWEKVINRVDRESESYKAAITEHFYDNAGFGPTAGALAECGKTESTIRYGKLLLANIGYSNDFRAQNPDRWWEALTYMIHSLWGGVTAAAAYQVFGLLKDPAYLEASYRATAGILYCYDTHATAASPLEKGMAASTYAVAGPHLNRPDLSRDRFGQSTFYRDGGIFAKLFENDSQTPDWDMGEELVAYLDNFGDKTFILETQEGIRVINGSMEEQDNEYLITSFAPYSRAFYSVSSRGIIELANQAGQRTITLPKK